MNFIVTIGREYGSGGRFIGRLLAEALKVNFYDNELLAKASQESGLNQAIFENYDEKKDGFFSGIYPSGMGFDVSMGQKVFLAQFDTIRKIAQTESAVIVGRCADYVLKDNPNVISVFIDAPIEDRVNRAVKYYNMDPKKAKDTIIKMDKKRKNYYNFYTDKNWGDANSYDLCVNSNIGVEKCVELIKNYVMLRLDKGEKHE